MAKNNLIDLFLELANPNKETGESRERKHKII